MTSNYFTKVYDTNDMFGVPVKINADGNETSDVNPMLKKKLSKNLTPVVVGLGVVILSVVVYKVLIK